MRSSALFHPKRKVLNNFFLNLYLHTLEKYSIDLEFNSLERGKSAFTVYRRDGVGDKKQAIAYFILFINWCTVTCAVWIYKS